MALGRILLRKATTDGKPKTKSDLIYF